MPSFEIAFEAYCEVCGEHMCKSITVSKTKTRQMDCILIDPCQTCLDKAWEKGEREGHVAGYDEGYNEGQNDAS